jgi:pantothenate kinase
MPQWAERFDGEGRCIPSTGQGYSEQCLRHRKFACYQAKKHKRRGTKSSFDFHTSCSLLKKVRPWAGALS